ncbi:MAG TPA: hydroxymethylglutaryl-CoA lyase [Rhizomicrobium sp.]|jgi:hydroxymethylglutaryl-CoA lyase|nr:hydroxymethylglutaryl-CoA lyase [Rhizomicrobium sp.]
MSDLPTQVRITEEGPREGFQIEKGPIATARKIELIDALSRTGLPHIQTVSFVNPKRVPGMADAEAVVAGLTMRPGVTYTGLWLNEAGLERAIATGRLEIRGTISLYGSERFLEGKQNRSPAEHLPNQHVMIENYKRRGIPFAGGVISAAFGCNFEGDVAVSRIVTLVRQMVDMAAEHGVPRITVSLADTMGWATPLKIKQAIGAVRQKFPDLELALHLHDTRGMGIANAYAGLEMGIARFDASVAGLGGCPFAGHADAAGNVCTEDLVFLCEEMGIETGIDLDALIDCARLAESVVGHPLPGSVMRGGSLRKLREKLSAGASA